MLLKLVLVFACSFLLLMGSPLEAMAVDYASGHKALEIWDEAAMQNVPLIIQIWLGVLVGSFALGLLFIWRQKIARWLVGGFILMALSLMFVVPAFGLTVFSGLVALLHLVFWSPGLYLLLTERPFLKQLSLFSVWSACITLVILISFVFDIRDAALYLDHVLGIGLFA